MKERHFELTAYLKRKGEAAGNTRKKEREREKIYVTKEDVVARNGSRRQ